MTAVEVANQARYIRLSNGDLSVEGGAIIYKNFKGEPTSYNPNGGKRTFALVLTKDVADMLSEDGWNVKHRPPREEGDDDLFYTEIVVNMHSDYPPKVMFITRYGDKETMSQLNEDNIGLLDTSILINVDLVVHPYVHGRANSAGATVKGYLKTLYATSEPVMDFGGKYDRFYE